MYFDKQMATRASWTVNNGKREGVMRSVLNNGQKCSAVYQNDKVVRGVVAFMNRSETFFKYLLVAAYVAGSVCY